MKHRGWVVLIAIVVLTWAGGPAVAQQDGPTLQITAGFDGTCHSGEWCPVYVVLSNEGADVEGELQVLVGGESRDAAPDVYASPVVLPAHSRKAYSFILPPVESAYRSNLKARFVAGAHVLLSEEIVVSWLREEDRLYGVASDRPSALDFLGDVAPAGGRAAVAHLDLDTLPSDPLGWEGLDVLVLADVDTAALSGEQQRALEIWVSHGGHLIVGGGAGAARTASTVADLLPVVVGGTRSVDELTGLGKWWRAPTVPGPYAVADAVLREGEVLADQEDEQGSLVLLARRDYGAGGVDFLAFDAGLDPFLDWADNVRLWRFIVEAGGVGGIRLSVGDGYEARDAVSTIPDLELPSMLYILGFTLVYTLLIGPVNYVVLRKLDRRELAWLTMPLLIVGFTAFAYVTGFQIRGSTVILHRLAAVYVPPGAGTGRVSEAIGLFSPRRTNYDVRISSRGVRDMYGARSGGSAAREAARPQRFLVQGAGVTLTGLRVDVGGIQPFGAEGYVPVEAVDADLRLVSGNSGHVRVEGTLRNTDVVLREAVLVVADQVQRLGDLEAGEVASVDLPYNYADTRPDIPEQILGPRDYWEERDVYRRYQFLRALFSYDRVSDLGSGVYLVGWVDKAPLSAEVVERSFSEAGTALYVYSLPAIGLEGGAAVVVPPGLITRQVQESTGEVYVGPEMWHLEPASHVVVRFTTWKGVAVRQVDELVLELDGSSQGGGAFAPAVSLWNEEDQGWERLDVGWGRHSIPDAGAYVGRSGNVFLRLDADPGKAIDVRDLAITIKGRR